MDTPYPYEIRIEGRLTERWSEWFEGLAICNPGEDVTILSGWLADQAALFGVLGRLHDLNLILVSVSRLPVEKAGGRRDRPATE